MMAKTYLKAWYGVTGSIEDKKDGTARLIVRDGCGKKTHDKIHKNHKAAMAAWYRENQ